MNVHFKMSIELKNLIAEKPFKNHLFARELILCLKAYS